jgi:fermentation-respiration switch protein FrsA (DUF1100 family)
LVVILTVGFIRCFEDSLIYFPTKGNVGPSPGEEVTLTASDGVKIHGWHMAHAGAQVTILHLHGNGGNLEHRRDLVRDLAGLKANVLAIDYRGYGKSEGKPDEKGLYADARAAYDWLCARTKPERIVLHGESLGAGPACELAATVPCGGLIVQSAFTSAKDMAARVMPWFPARWFMRSNYDNLSKVARISCRKLFIHGRADEMIPFEMGERLFAAAAEPKWIASFSGGHNDLTILQPREYAATLAKFLEPFR